MPECRMPGYRLVEADNWALLSCDAKGSVNRNKYMAAHRSGAPLGQKVFLENIIVVNHGRGLHPRKIPRLPVDDTSHINDAYR